MNIFVQMIAKAIGIADWQVEHTLDLLDGGATIPFISRYRKEATGSLDEVKIAEIKEQSDKLKEIQKRKETVLSTIEEQGKLTDELKKRIENCWNATELEDIYLPFKPKKRTRAEIARQKGLEPLATILLFQNERDIESRAMKFVKGDVESAEDALKGACDIIAEQVSEDEVFSEPLKKCTSHRLLALRRGESEGILRVSISPDDERVDDDLQRKYVRGNNECSKWVGLAVADAYKRLLKPSIENEFAASSKKTADEEAIRIFAANLKQLLMAAPLGQKRVMGLDPGFRTGCKLVTLDAQGNLLHHEAIFPHPPKADVAKASATVVKLVKQFGIEAIAIGNGTASRETESFVRSLKFDHDVKVFVVSEDGASVYSASKLAREEFPDEDVTVRGAVSIGRRLMDPLAELVKIDPKSIGVGQYQHDVDQVELKKSLDQTVENCVNMVGVNVNTASPYLLTYISGLGPALAKNIVAFRAENGPFANRKQLLKVPKMGAKTFEQCAGFLRIPGSTNPLDNTSVHPESYGIVEKMAKDNGCKVEELIANAELRKKIDLKKYVTDTCGLPTLTDIMKELDKPGRDPREQLKVFEFDQNVHEVSDLHAGMVLPGIISNITNFGCFVDIGVHEKGLVHISQLADKYVSDPTTVVSLGQQVMVKVLDVDLQRNRISLSMKGLK